jgi:hypothetical protein
MKRGDPTRLLAARVGGFMPNPIVTMARSLWPLVFGLVIAFALQSLVAPMIGPFSRLRSTSSTASPASSRSATPAS